MKTHYTTQRILLSFFFLLLILGVHGSLIAQLNGAYTINAAQSTGGTNYQTFTAAFNALISNGVNGPVVFHCVEGTYNEAIQLSSTSITGTSATNTVTFQAAASNTEEVLIQYTAEVVRWLNCNLNNITLRGLHFRVTGTNSTNAVYIYGGTLTNITFEDNLMEGWYTETSTSYVYATFYVRNGAQHNLVLRRNHIRLGSNGISFRDNQTNSAIRLEENTVEDYVYMGMYLYSNYSPRFIVDGNVVERTSTTGYGNPYGIYCQYLGASSVIQDNKISVYGSQTPLALVCQYGYGTASNPILIYNNVCANLNPNATGEQYAGYFYNNYHAKIYHNTFHITNSNSSSRAVYAYSSSASYEGNEFRNNIVASENEEPWLVYYRPGTTNGFPLSNNVYYQQDSSAIRLYFNNNGETYTDLAAWQTAVASDSNSAVADPQFISSANYTPESPIANNLGTGLGITTDFYGQPRSATTPDPGAIEFTIPINDARPAAMITPDAPLCDVDTSIVIVIKNPGLDTLTSLQVHYALNGGTSNVYNWTGQLPPQHFDTVTALASIAFADGDYLKVWTALPNGAADASALFDTLDIHLLNGLSGTYAIPADYATLNDAVDDLTARGVCGSTVFELAPGIYNEPITLPAIIGTSATATVTFRSATSIANDVTIQYNSTSITDNWVVKFAGADWVRFEDLKLTNQGNNGYSNVIELADGSDHVWIDQCWSVGSAGNLNNTTFQGNIYMSGVCHDFRLTNSRIEKGASALMAIAGNSTNKKMGMVITGNDFEDHMRTGLSIYYTDDLEVSRNVITNDSVVYNNNYMEYGLHVRFCEKFDIVGNIIGSDVSNGYRYGFYLYNSLGASVPRSRIANNCISAGSSTATNYADYAFLSANSGRYDFVHNALNRKGSSGNNYYCARIISGGLISVKNNSFNDYSQGIPLYVGDGLTVSESDHNSFYTEGTLPVFFASGYSSLEAYQSNTGMDMHSLFLNPEYDSVMICQTCNEALDNAGTAIDGIGFDIDSNQRSTQHPDIGPREYLTPGAFTLGADDTVCSGSVMLEGGPAATSLWLANNQVFNSQNIELSAPAGQPITYTVKAFIETAACGAASDTVVIRLVPPASLDANTHLCAFESTELAPGGGSGATYLWTTGETTPTLAVSEPGIYEVHVSEDGCESDAITVVTKSDSVIFDDLEVCEADFPVTLNATVNQGHSYAWSGGTSINTATNTFLQSGSYSVTVSDSNGCVIIDPFKITKLLRPGAAIAYTQYGLKYVFDASSSQYTGTATEYFWDLGHAGQTSDEATATITYPWSGDCSASYTVLLSVDNGCGEDFTNMLITPCPQGIDEPLTSSLSLYPNPAATSVLVHVDITTVDAILEIHDAEGRTVSKRYVRAGTTEIQLDVSKLSAGYYLVQLGRTDGSSLQAVAPLVIVNR